MDGYMNVVICLENPIHARALAGRLVQLTDRVHISIGSDKDIASDKDENALIVDDKLAAACSSASALLEQLKAMYTEKTGRRLCCAADPGPAIVGVGSAAGGSGTTAAAVTLARHLSGRLKGETALIFAGGSGNPMVYLEEPGGSPTRERSGEGDGFRNRVTFRTASDSGELDYMLNHNIDTDIMKYIKRDRYGPLAAVCAAPPKLLLDRMTKLINLEAAVIDWGSSWGCRAAGCHILAEVAARGDLRAAEFEEKAAARAVAEGCSTAKEESSAACHYEAAGTRIFILNKAAAMDQRDRFFSFPYDSHSFRITGNRIEIAMDGLYAAAARKAAEIIIEIISEIKDMRDFR